jgi:phosphate transport system substrate-binding protein
MRNWKAYLLASAALGCCGMVEPANAQLVYAGGATFPSPVYRQLFDCWMLPVDGNPPGGGPTGFLAPGPISSHCPSATGNGSGLFMQILYAPVGSGKGKQALINHDGSNSTVTGLGTPSATNTVPFVSSFQPTYGYPSFQFAGSDDVWNSADAANYAATGSPFGAILQIPALAGPVVIAFNGKDGAGAALNITNAEPAGAVADRTAQGYPGTYSGLALTRKAVCGIFTGHITQWNNAELTAANGGVPLGTGQIKVVHRSDGSGTNFIFTNALYSQCAGITGPNNETPGAATRSWQFRMSDRTTIACPDQMFRASNTTNWPDLGNDSCTPANLLNNNPGGGVFLSASGNSSVITTIQGNNGAIGYSTADFTQPVVAGKPLVANVQSQYDVDNATGAFQWPSPTRVANAMAAVTPLFTTPADRANPLNWSTQGQSPNPDTPNSYPIAGFTWLDFYQCYDGARSGGGTFANLINYLGFHYYNAAATAILNQNGFTAIPAPWRDQIGPLMTGGPSQMGNAGDPANPTCKVKSGA